MRKELSTILISMGSILVASGILGSIYIASLNESNTTTFLPSVIILGGTFFLGWGFYLKSNGVGEKFSGYGNFMLGLGALITLPQAPEILKHILKIETAIEKLQNLQEIRDGEVKFRSSSTIRQAKTFPELEEGIRSLIRTENAMPYAKSRRELKTTFLPLEPFSSPSGIKPPEPQAGDPSAIQSPPLSSSMSPNMSYSTSKLRVAPTPGMAYLTQEKADKIIATLKQQKEVDPSLAEALVQRNLEVCHPMDRASKCAR